MYKIAVRKEYVNNDNNIDDERIFIGSTEINWKNRIYNHNFNCFVSYPGHSLGGGLTPLQRCSQCILQPQPTGQEELWD